MKPQRILFALFIILAAILTVTACGGSEEPPSYCEEYGHDFSTPTVEKEATCTEEGKTTKYCYVCKEVVEEAIAATGHTEVIEEAVEATCEKDGKTEKKYCSVCDEVFTESEVIPGGHILEECDDRGWAPNYRPDGTAYEGEVYFHCSKCDDYLKYDLPVLTDERYTVVKEGETEKYTITIEGHTVEFTKPTFTLACIDQYTDNAYYEIVGYRGDSTNIEIPGELYDSTYKKTLPVKAIGAGAFKDNTSLVSITIPEGVEVISAEMFMGCSALTKVTLPESVKTIETLAFKDCVTLKTVNIPTAVTEIGDFAFNNCTSIETITLPLGLTTISQDLFCGCSSLKSITIPASVTQIGNSAFSACTSLESVIFEEDSKLYSIGYFAFSACKSLKELHSPAPMRQGALRECTALEKLSIPSFDFYSSPYYEGTLGGLFAETTGINPLNENILPESLTEVTIFGVSELLEKHLSGAKYLKRITIINAETVKEKSFYNCSALEELIIENVKSFGVSGSVCAGCASLKKVTLNNVEEIGYGAFESRYSLEEVNLNNVEEIGGNAFKSCRALKTVNITEGVTYIGGSAFSNCDALEEITLPSGITEISSQAFYNCPLLKTVLIGGVETIGYSAFDYCAALESVIIESDLKTVNSSIFNSCTSLKTVKIPDTVTSFSVDFSDCTALEASTYENGKYIGNDNNPYIVLIGYTADGSAESFKVKDGTRLVSAAGLWWDFSSYEIPKSVISIIGFSYECSMKSFDIHYGGTPFEWTQVYTDNVSITSYDGSLYFGDGTCAKDITEIVFDNTVTSFYATALSNFPNLVSLTISKSLAAIGFNGYIRSFENLYFDGTISDWCKMQFNTYPMSSADKFYLRDANGNYYMPTVIEIPEDIGFIQQYTFAGFTQLDAIVIPTTLGGINSYAFDSSSSNSLSIDFFFKGTKEEWNKFSSRKNWEKRTDIFFYSESEQTVENYIATGNLLWHYDSDGVPTYWMAPGNTVDGKTYSYSRTEIEVYDTYWQQILLLKQNNMLDDLLANDPIQLEMIKSSETKADFEAKLSAFATSQGSGITVSFADGIMTLTQNGSSVPMNYYEINGKIYVGNASGGYSVFFTISDNGDIYEDTSDDRTFTRHYYTEA